MANKANKSFATDLTAIFAMSDRTTNSTINYMLNKFIDDCKYNINQKELKKADIHAQAQEIIKNKGLPTVSVVGFRCKNRGSLSRLCTCCDRIGCESYDKKSYKEQGYHDYSGFTTGAGFFGAV